MSWETILGVLSGFVFVFPDMEAAVLLRTVLVVHICDAVMCWLFAHNNGYPRNLWTLFGFVFGVWALAILILLPSRRHPPQ